MPFPAAAPLIVAAHPRVATRTGAPWIVLLLCLLMAACGGGTSDAGKSATGSAVSNTVKSDGASQAPSGTSTSTGTGTSTDIGTSSGTGTDGSGSDNSPASGITAGSQATTTSTPSVATGSNPAASGASGATDDPRARALAVALSSGNATPVTQAEIQAALLSELDGRRMAFAAGKPALFGWNADGSTNAGSLTAIDWDPTHDSSWFTVTDAGQNQALLMSNWSYTASTAGTSTTLAVTGTSADSGGRYAAFGGNPLAVRGNAQMDRLMRNTIAWLSPRSSASDFKVVTAHLPGTETYWFPHESATRAWLVANYTGVTINGIALNAATQPDNRCDGAALAACLRGADLLVIGREQGPAAFDGAAVMQAVRDAQSRGIPVLYLHHYRDTNDLANRLLSYFRLSQLNNYWAQNGLKAWSPAALPSSPPGQEALQAMLVRLDQGGFSSTWSGCAPSGWRISCSGDTTYQTEFDQPATALRATLRNLDATNTPLFDKTGYRLEKLLVLLGDKYRENVTYPLSKATSGLAFYRAYFSDMAAFMHRNTTGIARNLGNFAGPIPATTPALTRTVSVGLPSSGTRDYMSGLYVMPGRSVTLTRTDNGTGAVNFAINMLRDTTWVFQEPRGMDRPTLLGSPRAPLAAGQSVTLTSPYGGPLFLFVDAAATGAQTATVQVSGVTTHPVLRDANDAVQVAAFRADLQSTPTNWVGMTSDTLVLHSTLANFNQSITAYGGDLAKLTADTWTYTIKDTYELAGFNATSGQLGLSATVTAFCTARGWDCTGTQHRRDSVQHVISDSHAACGSGCSGNPYDQDWAFDPMGWGETHEIGHNLQRSRLKIYAGQSTEVSNNLFPVHKHQKFNLTAAGLVRPLVDRSGTGLEVFNTFKTALAAADPITATYNAIWQDPSYAANNSARVMFYRQLVEYAHFYNSASLGDGWALFTLMYLQDRNLDARSANWSSVAANFGFATYATYPSAMDGNDFMLIMSSNLIGRDMRPMFDLWGVTYSGAASAQVSAYALPAAAKLLFPMSHVSQIPANVGAPITMTTSATYPTGY